MTTDPSVAEAHIAVGSLASIAPSEINSHVLLVVTEDGELSITGSACDHQAAAIVASAGHVLAMKALAAHLHDGAES